MKKLVFYLILFLYFNVGKSQSVNKVLQFDDNERWKELVAAPVALIPFPKEVEWTNERFVFREGKVLIYIDNKLEDDCSSLRSVKELLLSHGIRSTHKRMKIGRTVPPQIIQLKIDEHIPVKKHGYLLKINNTQVTITGKDDTGLFYGVQTLRQLFYRKNIDPILPGCSIIDWPAFGVRGFMHDNGRTFQSIDQLKAQLNRLSHYKYNTFHWHLTDNPAWRPESKIYPQLNDSNNRMPGRDPDSSYSFEDIKELIRYARERYITIIPELDMPGHSKYFETSFGFKMESESGMNVLEKLIDEFCNEIPSTDCPVIHLGSDEVHIPNPDLFMQRMTNRVKANGRTVMVWNPGITPVPGSIEQIWMENSTPEKRTTYNAYIDSHAGYLNIFDAYSLVQRYFFHQVCGKQEADSLALGGIICCWPDTRVVDKSKILLYNAVWPAVLTFSETVWCGRNNDDATFKSRLPEKGTPQAELFSEFVRRLSNHRDQYFTDEAFPFVQFGNAEWNLIGPYFRNKSDSSSMAFYPEFGEMHKIKDSTKSRKVNGGIIHPISWMDALPTITEGRETIYLQAFIKSDSSSTIHAVIGFETAARSNRRSAGIPLNNQWDANGGTIFINGKELPGPEWKNPGANRYLTATWEKPANEVPFEDEEFYWSRPPVSVQLKSGWNKIVIRVPRTYKEQNWQFVFVPVQLKNSRWVEDPTVLIVADL